MPDGPRRILAVLECRRSDEAVLGRAVAAAVESGGYLTLVAVPPRPARWANSGPYCVPQISRTELRTYAAAVLARAKAVVPPEIPLMAAVDEGNARDVIARRVDAAAHDLVVARRRRIDVRLATRRARTTVLAVAG
jgi:hypothetical protein